MKKIFLVSISLLFCAAVVTTKAAPGAMSNSEVELRAYMKTLWESRATLLRAYIISQANNSKDMDEDRDKLLQNAADLGQTIRPYYGSWASSILTRHLKNDVMLTEQLIQVAKGFKEEALDLTEKAKVEAVVLTKEAKAEALDLTGKAKVEAAALALAEKDGKGAPDMAKKEKTAMTLLEKA